MSDASVQDIVPVVFQRPYNARSIEAQQLVELAMGVFQLGLTGLTPVVSSATLDFLGAPLQSREAFLEPAPQVVGRDSSQRLSGMQAGADADGQEVHGESLQSHRDTPR